MSGQPTASSVARIPGNILCGFIANHRHYIRDLAQLQASAAIATDLAWLIVDRVNAESESRDAKALGKSK